MRQFIRVKLVLAWICSSILVSACSSNFQHQIEFNKLEPLRLAVLPFAQVDQDNQIVIDDGSKAIDDINLVSDQLKNTPAEITRNIVQSELKSTNLDVISPGLIDLELPHHGLSKDGELDYARILQIPASEYCKKIFDCDAVLYGKIRKWNRSYYGLQTVNSVKFELEIKSGRDDKTLFFSSGEDYESRGLSKGPTGYADLILEPIKGLNSALITDLAGKTVKKMLEPLQSNYSEHDSSSPLPIIYAISTTMEKQALAPGDKLVVLVFGSPNLIASFSIGRLIQNIPMLENDSGRYYGVYIPIESDSFKNENITVSLRDHTGKTTTASLTSAISTK